MRNIFKIKRANLLTENVIFIILNLVFLSILALFLFSKMGSAAVLEERYSKEIALMIDSAKPVMAISLQMGEALKVAGENGIDPDEIVSIEGNLVRVRLSDGGGYAYSFFNDVNVVASFDSQHGGRYVFSIYEK